MRDITAGVLSLRDGLDKEIWLIELPLAPDEAGGAPPVSGMPISPTPKPPTIGQAR